jgi:hypothetical protein
LSRLFVRDGALAGLFDSTLPFGFNFLSNFCVLHVLKKIDLGTGEFVAAFSIAFIASSLADLATLSKGYNAIRKGANQKKLFLLVYSRMATIVALFPFVAWVYCLALGVPVNWRALAYACLFVLTNSTWLYLYGVRIGFYAVSLLRVLSSVAILQSGSGKNSVLAGCLVAFLALVLLRRNVGPFSRFRYRHLRIALSRTLIYSFCRLPGLFFLPLIALLDSFFAMKLVHDPAQIIYVDGLFKLVSGLSGPLGVTISKMETLRRFLRASATRVLCATVLFFGAWLSFSSYLSDQTFFVSSCVFLGGCFILSYAYGLPLCRNFSDERWLCALGFVGVLSGSALFLIARWCRDVPLTAPVSTLVFLECSSLILRTIFRSRV